MSRIFIFCGLGNPQYPLQDHELEEIQKSIHSKYSRYFEPIIGDLPFPHVKLEEGTCWEYIAVLSIEVTEDELDQCEAVWPFPLVSRYLDEMISFHRD